MQTGCENVTDAPGTDNKQENEPTQGVEAEQSCDPMAPVANGIEVSEGGHTCPGNAGIVTLSGGLDGDEPVVAVANGIEIADGGHTCLGNEGIAALSGGLEVNGETSVSGGACGSSVMACVEETGVVVEASNSNSNNRESEEKGTGGSGSGVWETELDSEVEMVEDDT